jgi:LacI family transcriptional regulator
MRPVERVRDGGHNLEGLRAAIEQELHRMDRPTVIFALNKIFALAVFKDVRSCGLDMHGEIFIVGFDDFDWMSRLRSHLTTALPPVEEFASRAWSMLMRRIAVE